MNAHLKDAHNDLLWGFEFFKKCYHLKRRFFLSEKWSRFIVETIVCSVLWLKNLFNVF